MKTELETLIEKLQTEIEERILTRLSENQQTTTLKNETQTSKRPYIPYNPFPENITVDTNGIPVKDSDGVNRLVEFKKNILKDIEGSIKRIYRHLDINDSSMTDFTKGKIKAYEEIAELINKY